MSYEEMLKEFHRKYNHTMNYIPTIPHEDVRVLRAELIAEEIEELAVAMGDIEGFMAGPTKSAEEYRSLMISLADALADSLYVIVGTAVSYGIPIDKVFAEVHRSNMTKSLEKDEKSIKGKTLKGADYEAPDIAKFVG